MHHSTSVQARVTDTACRALQCFNRIAHGTPYGWTDLDEGPEIPWDPCRLIVFQLGQVASGLGAKSAAKIEHV